MRRHPTGRRAQSAQSLVRAWDTAQSKKVYSPQKPGPPQSRLKNCQNFSLGFPPQTFPVATRRNDYVSSGKAHGPINASICCRSAVMRL